MDDLEKSCMRKIYLRLLPFAILSYFLAYIDRINVSFAALTMRGDLNISAGDYGFALGTLYWGYFLFEVPSNVILEKVGARLWIARIMITGDSGGPYRDGYRHDELRCRSLPAGSGRGRLLPRPRPVFHLLVPDLPPRSDCFRLSDWLANCRSWGGAHFDGAARAGWDVGAQGLADHVHRGGVPTVLIGLLTLFVLTDRPAQAEFLTVPEKEW
jgi:MFS transporter, ACS family, tartrate transporter